MLVNRFLDSQILRPLIPTPQKHLDDYPELKGEKQAMNRRTLKAMQARRAGGALKIPQIPQIPQISS